MIGPNKIAVTLEVADDAQAHELQEPWEEIVTRKKLARTQALQHGVEAVMERAREALKRAKITREAPR